MGVNEKGPTEVAANPTEVTAICIYRLEVKLICGIQHLVVLGCADVKERSDECEKHGHCTFACPAPVCRQVQTLNAEHITPYISRYFLNHSHTQAAQARAPVPQPKVVRPAPRAAPPSHQASSDQPPEKRRNSLIFGEDDDLEVSNVRYELDQ